MKLFPIFFALLTVAGCGGGPQECSTSPCSGGLVCEKVQGKDKPMCFQPVQVEGTVKALGTGAPLGNVEVSAMEADGAAIGTAVNSSGDGTWSLNIESTRIDLKGTPVARRISVRAAGQDVFPFPTVLRSAPVLDTGTAKATLAGDGTAQSPWKLSSELTLAVYLNDSEKGRPTVSGTIAPPPTQAVLIVLEGAGKSYTTVPDANGRFRVFNVAPGGYQARAYSRGHSYLPVDMTVFTGTENSGKSIVEGTSASFGTVMGTLSLGAGSNGAGTSVVVVPESTFDETLGRGEPVPGLRAPETGAANVTGSYAISQIPDGKYVVLVGLENDGNVRDPATAVSHLTVSGGVASMNPVFKVNGAMEIVAPGATDALEEIAGIPKFTWKPYPSAKAYQLAVYTAAGVKVWENLFVVPNGSNNVEVVYGGSALKPGVLYQWRASAWDGNLINPIKISTTEELRGLFAVK
jgi:hypothetical protein